MWNPKWIIAISSIVDRTSMIIIAIIVPVFIVYLPGKITTTSVLSSAKNMKANR
jgi:hypothetical protein